MKKIGILTFHRAINYGAVLQSYSLITKLKSVNPDFHFEIIDYSTKAAAYNQKKEILSRMIKIGIQPGIDVYRRKKMFERFSDQLPIGKKKMVSDKVDEFIEYVNAEYDAVIVGSDAVFNWNYEKFPTAYLLSDKITIPKLSYAASAHRLFYKNEPKEKIDYVSKVFKTYNYIGIRDNETDRFVKYCCDDLNTHHNCDPTFLLDMETIHRYGKDCRDKLKNIGVDLKKPLVLVMTPNEKIGQLVSEKYGQTHDIVSLFIYNKAISKRLMDIDPFEWGSIFQYADFTVTEYFHGTILSLLNRRPTISIDSLKSSNGYEGKIKDLLCTRLKLDMCYINQEQLLEEGYELIDETIKKVVSEWSVEYLDEMISQEKKYFDGFNSFLRKIV